MKVLWRGLIPENVINYPDTKSYQHKTLLPPSQLPLGARQIEGSSIPDFHFTWMGELPKDLILSRSDPFRGLYSDKTTGK